MSSLVKTRPAVFKDYQLLTQLMKERESKAYLHAKTVSLAGITLMNELSKYGDAKVVM